MRALRAVLFSEWAILRWAQLVLYSSIILYFGRDIFIPVSFALLISFILYPFCAWLERRGFGRLTAVVIPIAFLMLAGALVIALLVFQFVSFLEEWPTIQLKLTGAMAGVFDYLDVIGISRSDFEKISAQSGGNVLGLIRDIISTSAFSVVLMILIPVYAVLILYHRAFWMKVLSHLLPAERNESLREVMTLTINAYYNFVKGMAIVYIVVGSLNSAGLLLLGVPHAVLFGFIASILTCVPYVGIMVGAMLPMAMAWITYDSIGYPLGVAGIFAVVQYLEANIIFPVAVSSRLNVNTFVMLLAIFAGGILWGMAGMILFVPFVGIAKLIADRNPDLKTISLILGLEKK